MFDTMTLTKIVASICVAMLIFLFANWGANAIFGLGEAGHEEHAENAYPIKVETASESGATEAAAAADSGPSVAELVAAADVAKGEKVFGKCKACHTVEAGKNKTGPSLHGVVGRPIGSVEGFGYSSAMAGHGGDWTVENLDAFLTKPKDFVPGTKMGFAGLKKPGDRAAVIAYLQAQSN